VTLKKEVEEDKQ